MTREEAARILDPETTAEAYVEYSYYGGFEGEKKWMEAVSEACRIGAEALIKLADSIGKVTAEVVEARRMGSDAIRELDAQEKHEPLTIDELRQMDGEPVWAVLTVKTVGQKAGYALIYNNCKYATQRWVNIPLWYSEYGEIWIAYRHRIDEEQTIIRGEQYR